MGKVILCVDNGNQKLKEAVLYLEGQGCKVYRSSAMDEQTLSRVFAEIEENEGRLDGLLLSVNEGLKDIFTGNVEQAAREDKEYCGKRDDQALLATLDEQLNGTRETIEQALPLLRKGEMKRIGLITKSASSISNNREHGNYAYHMTLAGLNMIGKIYFNLLRPKGFTFRWYADTENADAGKGMSAGEYFLTNFSYDPGEPYIHSEENRLVLKDSHLREIGW